MRPISEYSAEEDRIILEAQSRLGNRWSAIAAMLPGRTEDAVKIRWKSLCRVRKGQGARRSAQSGVGAGGDKGRVPTPKAGGMLMGPPHHMLHHHHMHPQLHSGGGGSFSGGPIVKSEELSAFPTTMRAPQQHMSQMQYASAMSAQQQQQQMSMPGGGYHVITSSQPAMMYASDMATVYDPSTGQYRKQSLASMQGGYGLPPTIPVAGSDAYSIDRRANVVTLTTPTHGYRGGSGVATVGYAPASGAAYATDMDGNIYTTSASGGGYVMASVYHPQQQMMSASYGYSVPQTSASVAGSFAQQLAPPPQQQSYHQQQQQQYNNQEQQESSAREQSQHQQQQSEVSQTVSASVSSAPSGKSPAKAGATPAPFNPAAMFAQAQQAKQQQQSPAASSSSSNGGSSAKPAAVNPVAAFLQQQQQQKSTTNGNGVPAVRPPFNPAAAFAQRFQAGKPPMPAPATTGKSRDERDDEDEDTENGDKNGGAEPSLKKVKPRLSIDAARASAARRMRTSGSGAAALAGRGSLDVFLNEIGDVGRLSDLKMDEFQTLDELWRVSDDMNRLSL